MILIKSSILYENRGQLRTWDILEKMLLKLATDSLIRSPIAPVICSDFAPNMRVADQGSKNEKFQFSMHV